jgi:hypothetical protein
VENIFAYVKRSSNQSTNYKCLKIVNILFILVCIIGFIQLIAFPFAFDWYQLFWNFGVHWILPDPHINRLLSLYFDPNFLANILIVAIVGAYYLWSQTTKKRYLISITIFIIALVLTVSRSGILGLFIVMVLLLLNKIGFRRIKLRYLVMLTATLVTTLVLVFTSDWHIFYRIRNLMDDPSALARFYSINLAWQMFISYPFGIGFNMISHYNSTHDVGGGFSGYDASLLVVLVTSGFIGLILIVGGLVLFFVDKETHYTVKILMISSIIMSFLNNLLFYTLWIFPFVLISLLINENERVKKNTTSQTIKIKNDEEIQNNERVTNGSVTR